MIAEAEVDQEGRIVLTPEMRESLQLTPGTRYTVESRSGGIFIQTHPPGLYWENGRPVFYTGRPVPAEAVDWVKQNREERADDLFGR